MSQNTWVQSLIGRTFGGYRITRMISRGGMGIVYEGVQESLGRPVAIKVLYPHFSDDNDFRERFTREAQAVAYLSHPNIVRIIDFGSDDGIYYIVLDLISGGSLRDRIAEEHSNSRLLPFSTTTRIIGQTGAALQYAHLQGYVHRDVKPGNILLGTNDHPYLTDFGVVRLVSESQMTATGALLGTPDYMAPEQSLGSAPVGPAADQYSLAVVAYEMFAGRVPFKSETPTAVLRMVITEPPPPLRSINSAYPPELDAVLMKALSKEPADRYDNVLLFVENLENAASEINAAAVLAGFQSGRDTVIEPVAAHTGAGSSGVVPPASPPDGGASGTASPPPAAPPPGNKGKIAPWIIVAAAVFLAVAFIGVAGAGYVLLSDDDEGSDPTEVAQVTATIPEATQPSEVPTSVTEVATQPETATLEPATEEAAATDIEATATEMTEAATEPATESSGEGELVPVILFASNRQSVHDSQIYIMNPDGSDQRQLTFASGHSWGPRPSPDGTMFFFSSTAPGEHENHGASGGGLTGTGNHDIYLASANGQDIENITSAFPTWDNGWSWSPDGRWITFTSDRDTTEDLEEPNWEIYIMSTDGSNIRRLTFNNAHDGWPSWTPDGEHIVFYSERDGDADIYIMDANGENVRPLIQRPDSFDTHPTVSPDGTKIVFSSQNPDTRQGEIYIANIDGTDVTRLTSTAANNYVPTFSPDGSKIVFVSTRDGNDEIYVMNIDGSDPERLTTDSGEDTTPFWGFLLVSN